MGNNLKTLVAILSVLLIFFIIACSSNGIGTKEDTSDDNTGAADPEEITSDEDTMDESTTLQADEEEKTLSNYSTCKSSNSCR